MAAAAAALFVLCAALCTSSAFAAMTFSTANVQQASLYQTIQIDLQTNPLVGDPAITAGDVVYFINSTNRPACAYTTSPTNAFAVTPTGTGGFTGQMIVPITPTAFTVGATYYPCYLSASASTATVVVRGHVPAGGNDTLAVWSTIYTRFAMTPTTANGGEGLVQLNIVQAVVAGRAINTGLTGTYTVLLVPCGSTTGAITSDCANPSSLVTACDAVGTSSNTPSSVISLSGLSGQSTGSVTGSFTVPYAPRAGGYYICVPYCFSSSAGCGGSLTAMSYTVVVPSAGSAADYTVSFGGADPGVYTRTPTSPQAREAGYVFFSGSGLSASDAIKVIRSADACTSPTASLITNFEHGAVEVVSTTGSTTNVRVYFVAPDLVTARVVGRVCYFRASSGLWSTAYLSATNQTADFTIDVLQPTGFTITAPSATPTVGETLTIAFAGSGLDGGVDLAFLSSATTGDPCSAGRSPVGGSSGSSSGTEAASSSAATNNDVFSCTMSGGTTAPTCTVTVDPVNNNLAMDLRVCYLKGSSASQQTNYAQISGRVSLGARNPTYAITPYPVYAGESVSLVFTGVGLSADDTVQLMQPDRTCSDRGGVVTSATLSSATEVIAGTSYQYTLVGAAETCIKMCYKLFGSSSWIVARAGVDQSAVSSSCAATNIYIATFPVRYTITNLPATPGSQLTVAETATVRFTAASGQSFTSTTSPTAVKVVQVADSCVTAPCGAAQIAACAQAQAATDYTSAVTGSGGVSYTSLMQVSTASVNYVVCVATSSGSGVFVPVLPSSQTSATSTAFGFTSAPQNPTLTTRAPSTWRVAMNTLTTTFTGIALNAATNVIYAVSAAALQTLYTVNGTTVAVCPPVSQTPATILVSAVIGGESSSTSVRVRYTRADQLYDGAVVYLCYAWSTDNGGAHITMAGTVTVAAAIPSSMAWVMPTNTSTLRAGQAIKMSFTSNLTSLSAVNDAVYFYRFTASSIPNPNCYCDPTACARGMRVSYSPNTTQTISTTGSITDDTNTYSAPLGFNNYDYVAVYIICYATAGQAADTYVGRVTVALANPTYYTLDSVASPLNRVGAPINITVVRRCLTSSCTSLSLTDSLRLVSSSVQCADLTSASLTLAAASSSRSNTNTGSSSPLRDAESDDVQAIGDPVLGASGLSFMRRFVVDTVGTYRVCYRLASETTYGEVVFSNSYVRTYVTVASANPLLYTSVPAVPSAGQFVTINLTCSVMTLCSTCTMVRIVPGERASCWEAVTGTYSSDSCLTVTSVQFPDQYFAAGTYTVCYGGTLYTSRRIPTSLTVAAANPASFTPTSSSGNSVFTNQGSNYTLDITGTSLATADTVFLLPDSGFSCHDLRTGEIQSDGQLASWLNPSVSPFPLTLTAAGVAWVVSNQDKRFGVGILFDTDLCPGEGAPCAFKLCYLRAGTSWAPVTYLPVTPSSGSSPVPTGVQLVASNPSSVEFDRYPLAIDMYVMATVRGAGLQRTDTVIIHETNCAGAAMTTAVQAATYVSASATEWVGVLRVTGSASSYAVCYWRATVATEIASISFTGQTGTTAVLILTTPLYYMLSPANFTTATTPVTHYEQLIVGGSFTSTGAVGTALTYAQVITVDTSVAECNYAPFQSIAGSNATTFPIAVTLSSVPDSASAALPLFQGRLNVATGRYALCMNTSTGLFRAVATPPDAPGTAGIATALTVRAAAPGTYASVPTNPMTGQIVTLTFALVGNDSSPDVALAAGDTAQIIDGSLYECGFSNATILAEGLTTLGPATPTPTTTVTLTLPMTVVRNGVPVSIAQRSFTVCYRKQHSTFATSPVTGGTVDRNFFVMSQVPTQWTAVPTQAQVAAPINITFYGDSNASDYLTARDTAFLVPIPDAATPDAALCLTSAASSSTSVASNSAETRPIIRAGTMTKPGSVNTQWNVPAGQLQVGAYMMCYVAANNGQPLYVSSPATLTVYPTQSPSGAYIARSATTVTNNLNVWQGERVYLLFETTVALNVVLDNTAASSSSSAGEADFDVVRITTDSTCATPLLAGVVDAIPSEFGYAALGLVDSTTGLTIPYLNLRVRANVGNYYVCMRRAHRTSTEAYYNFEVVGGLYVNPAVLAVAAAPVSAFTTAPGTPRAWVPHTNVTATYGSGFSMSRIFQFFFVPFTGSGAVTDSNELLFDSCYRPNSTAQANSTAVTLVNRTLQVYLSSPMFTQYSFGTAGTYLLCYQVQGNNIASVYPSSLTVLAASPTSYAVPSVIAIQNTFTMTFNAPAAIFVATFSHVAQVFTTSDATVVPNCSTGVAPTGGTTHFTSFSVTSPTAASVVPRLLTSGYYYVCFLTYTTTEYYFSLHAFAVPNAAGGYVFSVGLTGAQRYTVSPQPAYLGQLLHLVITGNQLTRNDRVKVVRVSQQELSGSGSVASNSEDYTAVCTASAPNADAAEPNGAAGSVVNSTNEIVADYYPRVNETGTFILCYQSALLSGAWVWVTDVHQFTVGSASPTHYALSVNPPYETEVLYLYIHDAPAGLLQDADQLKLVDRGASGFDCTPAAPMSSAIGLVSYVQADSNSSVHVYRLCASSVATVTVCYALATASSASTTSWAEVPLQSPPPTYIFAPVRVDKNPFLGPFRAFSSSSSSSAVAPSWVAPRPYEPFTFFFTSAVANFEVLRVAFARSPATVCAADVAYVAPLFYEKQTAQPSEFEVVLPFAGNYAVFLGPYANGADPNITQSTPLVVGQCDPCHFVPNYALVGGNVSLSFPSSVGNSLSNADEIRIFPVTQGLGGRPCEAPEGPYAGVTLTPVASASTPNLTVFTVTTGTEAEASKYLGEYHVCYRKLSSSSSSSGSAANARFAVVAENNGTASIFSIYPVDLLAASVCPASPMFALETAVYNVTAKDPTRYPNVDFAAGDQMVIVPTDVFNSSTGCANITDVRAFIASTGFRAQQPTLDTFGRGRSNWHLTLAAQEAATNYVWCFKMLYDSLFRSIAPAPQTVEVEDPDEVTTIPPVVLPDSTGVQFIITGTGLASTDGVYIVPASESCAETCYRPLTPTQWTGTTHTVTYVNSTTVIVNFASAINTVVTLGVCYRRAGRYLTRLANIYIGEPNPVSYTVNFEPQVGTQPTLTFTGTGLTATDAMLIVQPGATCLLRNAVAVGTFVSVSGDAKTSRFNLTLTRGVVVAQSYTVCYQISTVGAYVVVRPLLPVLDTLPTAVTTSNTPMRGRATVLSVANPQIGDEMYIACPGCSCYDLRTATVPYGSPSATATEVHASGSSSSVTVTITIRVGFNDTQRYPVCYRHSNSGYAQIGGPSSFVTPVTNSPSAVLHQPAAGAQFQGQRLHYNFSTYSAAVPLRSSDAVMLVQAGRQCWETPAMSTSGIVVGTSTLTSADAAAGVGEWAAHIPSLGPGVPPDATTLFPLSYLLCYRESTQAEYVSVPYVMQSTVMAAADPVTFSTVPAVVETGMLGVNTTFAYAVKGQAGDEAYIVQFTTLTNTVCDDAASTVIATLSSAFPVYTFGLSGESVVGNNNTAMCYVRADGTVAEVPQLLPIVQGNPTGYVTNITAGQQALQRQYIQFTIRGTGLSATADSVVFTDVHCAEAPPPPTPSPFLARQGDATSNGTAYVVEAQFIASRSPISIYVCYRHNSVWREIGQQLVLYPPRPSTVTVFSSTGSGNIPRVGQHIFLMLNDALHTLATGAAVLSARPTGAGTWCHNFTAADVQEQALVIQTPSLLSVPVWETPGLSRLCVLSNNTVPWSDVAATVDAASIYIFPANPSSMDVYPAPPRVGQRVTLTFHLVVNASAQDAVKITTVDHTACDEAVGVPGLEDVMLVSRVVNESTTTITLVDTTDPLAYRSFNRTGNYRVCYFSYSALTWGVVGGTLAAGTVTVVEAVPQSWSIASGSAQVGQSFALAFYDTLGVLQPTAGRDLVWAAPSTVNCAQDPHTCTGCLIFEWDTTKSNASVAVTSANATVRVGEMNLCYRLSNATAALVPGSLNITTGPVQCVEQTSFISGQRQEVTFRLQEGTNVTDDSWRLSFFATTALNCQDRYVGDFVPGLAVLQSTTSTAATYSVVWPVGLGVDTDRYTVCYDHNGVIGTVCTCGQIDANTGECYLMATPGSPQSFTPTPQPTYVGQAITLTFAINESMTAYPPTAIKFVTYTNELTSCDADAAFTPVGAVLTRVSSTVYTYAFKHDYTLGTSTLLVCALTDLSPTYARVASTIKPSSPTSNNTLWIRPFLTLSTFPSSADYLRALQTLNLTFTMTSRRTDDLVNAADQFTLVGDPANCVESYIDGQDPVTQMAMFVLTDVAFLTLPSAVLSASPTAFTSRTLATFANSTTGKGVHYFCYKPAAGTYAPVLPALPIGDALFTGCDVTEIVSPGNGDLSGSLRAMYYAPTTILGTTVFATLANTSVDAIRVVPQKEWCTNDAAVVFTTSLAATTTPADLNTVFFASLPGTYKVCYRFGTATTNWSPACPGLAVTNATPVGAATGCWNVGQTLQVNLSNPVTGHVFNAADRLRFIAGTLPCLEPNRSIVTASPTITVGDAVQPPTGFVLANVSTGQTTYAVSDVFLRMGTTSVRLCYTDAAGNEFAIPMDYANRPGQSSVVVQGRQPGSLRLDQRYLQVGQRLLLNFSSAGSTVTPPLVPYGTLPSPYTPGPAFNGTFDGATMLPISNSAAYVDGRCAAALRSGTLVPTDFLGVYGPTQAGGSTNIVPYTVGSYDPTVPQYYITCYQLATCGVVDSGDPLRVYGANPSNVFTVTAVPRRGQLIIVFFDRDTSSPNAVHLTPNGDRGAKQANLAACWSLSNTAGTVVVGTPDRTNFTTIFPAQAPARAANTSTRSCYRLVDGSWSEVPNGVAVVLPANPTNFETLPTSARVDQVNYIRFHGSGLGATDRMKIIAQSLNCSEDSVPPSTFAAYTAASPTTPTTATSAGWTVMEASSDGTTTTLNFTARATGTYSVCYRLATDTVWTLVYADLVIYEHNPANVTRTPVASLEGELFTLNFTASAQGQSGMSAKDRVVLYFGNEVNCVAPTEEQIAPSVSAAPSRTDRLPNSLAFQMAAGTRGSYTLCYQMASATAPGGYTTVWGYDTVVIAANPENVTLYPIRSGTAATTVYRANELLTYVFGGWGLVATADKTDEVKLISASSPSAVVTDTMCQQTDSASAISYNGFYANGTYAVQVWRASSAAVGTQYAVCYKLNGGQYHVIGDVVSITEAANPSGATSPKMTGLTTTLSVGESMSWTLTGASTGSCAANEAAIFYSDKNCSDVPYYANVSAVLTSIAATNDAAVVDNLFPAGAAIVTNCSAATLVRVPSAYTFPRGATSSTLSVCYLSNGTGVVSVLSDRSIALSAGQPPVLNTTLSVPAQEVFTVNLTVIPTTADWAVLVADANSCVGITPPTNDAYFTNMTYNAGSGVTAVTAAVPGAGMYHVCYSHPSDVCAAGTGRECARVVATVAATASNPQSWSGTPSPVYVTGSVAITMTFSSSADGAAQGTTATAWLAPILSRSSGGTTPAPSASLSMMDVWASCTATRAATAPSRLNLTFDSTSGAWTMRSAFTASGSYALCYTAQPTAALHLFGPLGSAGPVVVPSTVATVTLPPSVTVANTNTIVLTGGGLSTSDGVVAVAVPRAASSGSSATPSSSAALPADICTNTAYTPRVPATSSSASPATSGLSTLLSNIVFNTTGKYVLCYTATYGGTTADEASSSSGATSGTPVLITETPFAVVSSVLGMTVVSPALEVGVPLELLFSGNGLATSDTAALVYIGNATTPPTVATVCESSGVTYTRMQSANAAGTTATYVTTPARQGLHMVCFRASAEATPILLPTQLNIGVQTAARAVFSVQPGGCTALQVCRVQPTVTLLDSSNVSTSAPFCTLAMKLYMSDGTTEAPPGYLSAGTAYREVDFTNFTFYALRISTAGTYVMRANVTLASGQTLLASSTPLTVDDASSGTASVASVVCVPPDILDRTTREGASAVIDCMITALVSSAPGNYTIVANAGAVSTVVRNGTTPGGLPTYQFSVTPPAVSATSIVNFIAMVVTPAAPYESWPVENSPVTVRLTTAPSALTTLQCAASGSTATLPLPNMIRVGASLQCGVQGVASISGVPVNIVAPPDDLTVTQYSNGDSGASKPVDIGAFPVDVNGLYSFTLAPSSALNFSVAGTVLVTTGGTPTPHAMVNSPVTYILIGVPTAGASRLTCVSTRTGSALWFAPAEPLLCTATLANDQGRVNGLQGDYTVVLPNGGSVVTVTDSDWGPTLVWNLTAPPQPQVSGVVQETSVARLVGRAEVEVLAAPVTENFGVQVRHTASAATIGTYSGALVYVTRVVTPLPTLTKGATVSMTLVGVGLDTTHRYALGNDTSCATVQAEATPKIGNSEGALILTFTVPPSVFIICFAPADARNSLQSLFTTQFTPEPSSSGGSSGDKWVVDDLILLIIGVVFLFILLVLLVLLLWCIFCCRDDDEDEDKVVKETHRVSRYTINNTTTSITNRGTHVYMPPRANTRYVLAMTDTPPTQPAPLPIEALSSQQQQLPSPSPAPSPQPQQAPNNVNTATTNSSTKVRINIHDTDTATAPPAVNNEAVAAAPKLTAPAPALADPPSASSTLYSSSSGLHRRHRHRRSSSSAASTSSSSTIPRQPHQHHHPLKRNDPAQVPPLPPSRLKSDSRYTELDQPVPAAPSDSSGDLPQSTNTARRQSLPPLPPPPLVPAGSAPVPSAKPIPTPSSPPLPLPTTPAGLVQSPQKTARTPPPVPASAASSLPPLPPPPTVPTATPADGPARNSTPMGRSLSTNSGEEEMVGPFRVTGHTSTPMVRSPASSRHT
ncbi:hypothetical protein ABB37_08115 [Leptomonas pyrrhocoris]|uniref:Membrane-associated protein n=1 Tax=Leptomonas pyrrhocoris TaxID=157538 RepID=A0A0M9FU28_LEPPY|nr:hypothetical protein ABB37_08115 [Leptomonas pyrrhocoris]KPA75959.1 hypothetical protein ABB37_08115 [Leptomonas pyrrhocoris]|eukprot:XP_015654398.1 hypothetical protein ABB37_08115 [Leptomonas pyrrhocoris]